MSEIKKNVTDSSDPTFLHGSEFSKSICSAMDCTGLIPSLPDSEAEQEAYEEMYQFCLTNAAAHPAATPPTGSDPLEP